MARRIPEWVGDVLNPHLEATMRTHLQPLSEKDLALIGGGTSKGGTPHLNVPQASAGPAGKMIGQAAKFVVKEGAKTVVGQAILSAGEKAGTAIKNHTFHANPTPVADRTHRWLHWDAVGKEEGPAWGLPAFRSIPGWGTCFVNIRTCKCQKRKAIPPLIPFSFPDGSLVTWNCPPILCPESDAPKENPSLPPLRLIRGPFGMDTWGMVGA